MIGDLRSALDPVADALDELRVEYRIGGSVASSALGVARSTLDKTQPPTAVCPLRASSPTNYDEI